VNESSVFYGLPFDALKRAVFNALDHSGIGFFFYMEKIIPAIIYQGIFLFI
jgi:hypothetical protein